MRTCTLVVCLLLAGCSGYRSPSLQVAQVDIGQRGEEAVQLQFTVDLANPNDEPLKLLALDYALAINGRRVYRGKRSPEATLDRRATRRVRIPAVLRYDQLGDDSSVPVEYTLSGSLLYITPGEIAEILLDTGIRKPTVSFRERGTVNLE